MQAFDITPSAGIPVPVPGSAHVGTGFYRDGAQSVLAQPVQHIEACETGTYNNRVEILWDHEGFFVVRYWSSAVLRL
ncbi:hypothetical protein GCM10023067_01710 [Aminobacter aganoensis]